MDFWDWKSVEGAGNRQGISSHVFKDKPIPDLHLGKHDVLDNLIQTVAGRSPNTAGAVFGTGIVFQRLRDDDLMIVKNAVEAAVDPVVDVIHIVGVDGVASFLIRLDHFTNGVDVARQGVSRTDVEPAGFRYHLDGGVGEEIL